MVSSRTVTVPNNRTNEQQQDEVANFKRVATDLLNHTTTEQLSVSKSSMNLNCPENGMHHIFLPSLKKSLFACGPSLYGKNGSKAISTSFSLPLDIVGRSLDFLDGNSLLNCTCVSVAWNSMTRQRGTWKRICLQRWPTMSQDTLQQLPGAPSYDLIRLYSGCWKRCFAEKNEKNATAELSMKISNFCSLSNVKRIVSDTFSVNEHNFCLWVFPRGNPHEPEYAGKVLSVYLVLTDLNKRLPDWLTCAVFTLSVINHKDPSRTIEWHSSLGDNKFDKSLFNWGVHSLGLLETLHKKSYGYLKDNELTVNCRVRLLSITFCILLEKDFKNHEGFGLTSNSCGLMIELPFCCTLNDLQKKLVDELNISATDLRIWCFNQPVSMGKSFRPRKLLSSPQFDCNRSLFGYALTDGVDIDAYSYCTLYVERIANGDQNIGLFDEPENCSSGYLFIKLFDPMLQKFQYIGRVQFTDDLSTAALFLQMSCILNAPIHQLSLYCEKMLPSMISNPISISDTPIKSNNDHTLIQDADILIFCCNVAQANSVSTALNVMLESLYERAHSLLNRKIGMLTLGEIENLASDLDIPKFRVRSAFRKCNENPWSTLKYILEGRHLGFICDSCGETDFKGPRFNCKICSDYDLCEHCHNSLKEVHHRYANVDGKWQRVFNFREHHVDHPTCRILPVFYSE